jgi:metal-responsive CopG/Arc/MetJ family transcriptional regulator
MAGMPMYPFERLDPDELLSEMVCTRLSESDVQMLDTMVRMDQTSRSRLLRDMIKTCLIDRD